MGLFGKTDHEEQAKQRVNEWCKKLRSENHVLDRQIRQIQREEEKGKRALRETAKKGDRESATILAKEIVRTRKAQNRISSSKAHLNSVMMQMRQMLATQRLAGSVQRSTEVMQSMQILLRVPEISQTMQQLTREMMRAGLIDEMMQDTFESLEPEDLEELADKEVDNVLWELTEGKLGNAPDAVQDTVGAASVRTRQVAGPSRQATKLNDTSGDAEALDIEKQLEALRTA